MSLFNTYASGATFITNRNITKADIITLCNRLSTDEYKIHPEAICEGGLVYKFLNFGVYKSIRLCLPYWPQINWNVMNEWKDNDDVVISVDTQFTLFLKSRGAPAFTVLELHHIEAGFTSIGCDVDRTERMEE